MLANNVFASNIEQINQWYEKEVEIIVNSTEDPKVLRAKIEKLTKEFQKKLVAASQPKARQQKTTLPQKVSKKNFIPIFVRPYYSGPRSFGAEPEMVLVNEQYNQKLRSTKPDDILNVANAIRKENASITPLTFFVLSARLYDVGLKDDAVFWFYAAKDRLAATIAVGKPNMIRAQKEAGKSFSSIAGNFINGYAFCDITKQNKVLLDAALWSQKNPYEVLLNENLHKAGIDPTVALKKSAQDRIAQAKEAMAHFSDKTKRETLQQKRAANQMSFQYCD